MTIILTNWCNKLKIKKIQRKTKQNKTKKNWVQNA